MVSSVAEALAHSSSAASSSPSRPDAERHHRRHRRSSRSRPLDAEACPGVQSSCTGPIFANSVSPPYGRTRHSLRKDRQARRSSRRCRLFTIGDRGGAHLPPRSLQLATNHRYRKDASRHRGAASTAMFELHVDYPSQDRTRRSPLERIDGQTPWVDGFNLVGAAARRARRGVQHLPAWRARHRGLIDRARRTHPISGFSTPTPTWWHGRRARIWIWASRGSCSGSPPIKDGRGRPDDRASADSLAPKTAASDVRDIPAGEEPEDGGEVARLHGVIVRPEVSGVTYP